MQITFKYDLYSLHQLPSCSLRTMQGLAQGLCLTYARYAG